MGFINITRHIHKRFTRVIEPVKCLEIDVFDDEAFYLEKGHSGPHVGGYWGSELLAFGD